MIEDSQKTINFLPEWHDIEAILMAMPHEDTDWNYCLEEAIQQYIRILKALTDEKITVILLCRDHQTTKDFLSDYCDCKYIKCITCEFNDTWTRDYGPLSVTIDGKLKGLDFGFNGWGLKFSADKDNIVIADLFRRGIIPSSFYINNRKFILEGGSVETDGKDRILTTKKCLCSENRNGGLSPKEAENFLKYYLGAKYIYMLEHGALEGDDTDSHIDTLARFGYDDTIIYCGCNDKTDSNFEELKLMKKELSGLKTPSNKPFELIDLPLPSPIFDENGFKLPATYCNYLITKDKIFVPTYNQEDNDKKALKILASVFPKHKIIGIDCTILIKQHGSLHCATMQIPKGLLKPEIFQ